MLATDKVITNVNSVFTTYLWPTVTNRAFLGRVFRNIRDKKLIPETQLNGEYKEVKFDDSKNAVCFFDPDEDINDIDQNRLTNRDVNIIFAVKTTAIYPSLSYRVTEEIYRDVIDLIEKHFLGIVNINSIKTGLNAYGDFDVSKLKAYDMQPWHTFALKTNMIINFKNC